MDQNTAMDVLLVDPADELDTVEDALHSEDEQIRTETLTAAAEIPTAESDPDIVVVLHHGGGDTDGVTQLRAVREYEPELPVVIFGVNPPSYYAEDALTAGASDVICIGENSTLGDKFATLLTRRIRHAAGNGESFQTDRELLDALLDNLPHQIFIKDDTGRIADASQVTATEYGLSREQVRGLTDFELFTHDEATHLWEEEAEIMETESPKINDVQHFTTDDGQDRWVSVTKAPRYDGDGNVVGTIGTTHEITERRRKEEILDALHTASRELVDAETKAQIASAAVDIADDIPDLPIVHISLHEDGRLEQIDTSEDSPPQFAETSSVFQDAYRTDEQQHVSESDCDGPTVVALPLGDHGVLGITSRTGALDEDDRELASVLAAHVEASLDRAEREEQLRAREQDLKEQNERLERFASIVSHDLRNPLNVSQGRLELARDNHDGDNLAAVANSLDRMERLIDELLVLAREGNSVDQPDRVSLATHCQESWKTVDSPEATLRVQDDTVILADEFQLTQLFENLFRNAIEHGGESVVITVGALREGFFVEDDGPGIPESARQEVFESGYTTNSNGTGFGLSIVDDIADAHEWSVEITDGTDGGARFEFSGVETPDT